MTDQVEITYPESTVPVESAVAEPEKKEEDSAEYNGDDENDDR